MPNQQHSKKFKIFTKPTNIYKEKLKYSQRKAKVSTLPPAHCPHCV
jgi:hypothetical protein